MEGEEEHEIYGFGPGLIPVRREGGREKCEERWQLGGRGGQESSRGDLRRTRTRGCRVFMWAPSNPKPNPQTLNSYRFGAQACNVQAQCLRAAIFLIYV